MNVISFDAGQMAIELGDRRLVNSIMLGAIAPHLCLNEASLKQALLGCFQSKGECLLALNDQAYQARHRAAEVLA